MKLISCFSILFILFTAFPAFAQEQISYPLNLSKKTKDAKIFVAEKEGEVQAVSLVDKGQIHFYELNQQTAELVERNILSTKILRGKGFISNGSTSNFYGVEMLDYYVEEGFVVYTIHHNSEEDIAIKKYPLPKGDQHQFFVTENAAFAIGYSRKGDQVNVHRYRLGDGEPEKFTFTIPKALKFKSKHFNRLDYRDAKRILNPGELAEKNHLFIEGDYLYFVYQHAGNGFLELLSLNMNTKEVQHKKLAARIVAGEINVFVHKESLLYFRANQDELTVHKYDMKEWDEQKILNIHKNDTSLPSFALRNESDFIWSGKEVKEVNAAKLIRKLSRYKPYVYVHPGINAAEDLQIVIGSYGVSQNAAPMMGAGGMMSFGVGMGGSGAIHPYILFSYNQTSGALKMLQRPWKNPSSVWADVKSKIPYQIDGKPVASWIRNLGEEMLIVYFDRKNQSVVVRYEPLFGEEPAVLGTK